MSFINCLYFIDYIDKSLQLLQFIIYGHNSKMSTTSKNKDNLKNEGDCKNEKDLKNEHDLTM